MKLEELSLTELFGWVVDDPAWCPPSAKNREEFADFAREALVHLKERDRNRSHTVEHDGFVRQRRGMVLGDYMTDDKARRLVVCMLLRCQADQEPPPADLVRLAAYCLCGADKVENIPHPALAKDFDADRHFRRALDYKLENPGASDEAIAAAAGVSRGTVAKVYNRDLRFMLANMFGVK